MVEEVEMEREGRRRMKRGKRRPAVSQVATGG